VDLYSAVIVKNL